MSAFARTSTQPLWSRGSISRPAFTKIAKMAVRKSKGPRILQQLSRDYPPHLECRWMLVSRRCSWTAQSAVLCFVRGRSPSLPRVRLSSILALQLLSAVLSLVHNHRHRRTASGSGAVDHDWSGICRLWRSRTRKPRKIWRRSRCVLSRREMSRYDHVSEIEELWIGVCEWDTHRGLWGRGLIAILTSNGL